MEGFWLVSKRGRRIYKEGFFPSEWFSFLSFFLPQSTPKTSHTREILLVYLFYNTKLFIFTILTWITFIYPRPIRIWKPNPLALLNFPDREERSRSKFLTWLTDREFEGSLYLIIPYRAVPPLQYAGPRLMGYHPVSHAAQAHADDYATYGLHECRPGVR